MNDSGCTVGIPTLSTEILPDFLMEVPFVCPAHESHCLLSLHCIHSPIKFLKSNSFCCLVMNNNAAVFYSHKFHRHRGITTAAVCLPDDIVGWQQAHIMCFCVVTYSKSIYASGGCLPYTLHYLYTRFHHTHTKINQIINTVLFSSDPPLFLNKKLPWFFSFFYLQ